MLFLIAILQNDFAVRIHLQNKTQAVDLNRRNFSSYYNQYNHYTKPT